MARPRNVKATTPSRALYNDLLREYITGPDAKRKYPGNVIITDSWLRFEVSIQSAGVSSVKFNTLTNEGGLSPTEQRLNMTDRFCAAQISVVLMRAIGATAATDAQKAIAKIHTFPNDKVFTGGAGTESANLEGAYNGNMKITVDSVVYVQSLDIRRFYRVGMAQQGQAVSSVATTGVQGASQWEDYAYPFAPLTPAITLSGIGKNDFIINTPNNIAIDMQATAAQNFLVCYLRGYLIQNYYGCYLRIVVVHVKSRSSLKPAPDY